MVTKKANAISGFRNQSTVFSLMSARVLLKFVLIKERGLTCSLPDTQSVVTDIVRGRETQKCKEQFADLRKLHLERRSLMRH